MRQCNTLVTLDARGPPDDLLALRSRGAPRAARSVVDAVSSGAVSSLRSHHSRGRRRDAGARGRIEAMLEGAGMAVGEDFVAVA